MNVPVFLDKGFFFGLAQISIDLDKVNAISGETGILFGAISIEDGASSRMIKWVPKGTVVNFTNKVRDAIEARKNASQSSQILKLPGDDVVSQLETLASLVEKGLVTKEEFAQQKLKLLRS